MSSHLVIQHVAQGDFRFACGFQYFINYNHCRIKTNYYPYLKWELVGNPVSIPEKESLSVQQSNFMVFIFPLLYEENQNAIYISILDWIELFIHFWVWRLISHLKLKKCGVKKLCFLISFVLNFARLEKIKKLKWKGRVLKPRNAKSVKSQN